MPFQQHIENRSDFVRFSSQGIWLEAPVCKPPQSILWNADEVYGFRDSLAGKSSGQKLPCLAELLPRQLGAWKGKVWVSPDFDDNQEIIELFEESELLPDGDD